MKIDIFCESGEIYGLGHLKRCENLVSLLSAYHLNFEINLHSLPCNIQSNNYDLVIIDSYITPQETYNFLAKHSKALLCLDDLSLIQYPKHSFVLSPTFTKNKFRFSGKDFIILNPIFQSPPLSKERKNHIFITLGGSNQNTLLSKILSSLPQHFTPHILSPTFSHPNSYSNLSAREICALIDSCEFVICSGGGSLNEAISRNKKIIALCIAPNQKQQLNSYGGQFPIIFNPFENLDSKICSLLSKDLRPFYLSFGSKLPFLLQNVLYQALNLPRHIRPFFALSKQDKRQVLHLRNQKQVREASFNSSLISFKQHLQFINSLSCNDFYFAFFHNSSIVGVGSLKITHPSEATLGIYKDLKRKGIGHQILDSLCQIATKLGITTLNLEVLRTNTNAICFYQKHNFTTKQEQEKSLWMQKRLHKETRWD